METIAVAIIGAVGYVTQALVSTRRHKRIEASLGAQNGQGNALEILECLKASAQRHDEKLDDLAAWQRDHLGRWHQRSN